MPDIELSRRGLAHTGLPGAFHRQAFRDHSHRTLPQLYGDIRTHTRRAEVLGIGYLKVIDQLERGPGAVLFDIDGTLVDSNYLHVNAWLQAFRAVGHPMDAWRIHRGQGMGSSELLATLLGEAADQVGSQARQQHSEHYRQSADLLRAFDGARDLVAAVAQRGAKVVLATSAAPDELELLRCVLDIEDDIAEITAAEDVEAAKPAPDLVHVALQRAGVGPERAVYVGDTVWDVKACAKAGVACVGVLSGGISASELNEAGAIAVYEDCRALLRELDASPLAALWV